MEATCGESAGVMVDDVRLSLIVPVYNGERTIERALESALAWEGDDMELIVVDDGCTDTTPVLLDALAAHDARVRVIHQANAGRSVARNVGIAAAHGDWLMFLDADDYLLADALPAVREALASEYDLVMFALVRDDGQGIPCAAVRDSLLVGDLRVPVSELISFILRDETQAGGIWREDAEFSARRQFYLVPGPCAKLYRSARVLELARRLGRMPFPASMRVGEDAAFVLAYLSLLRECDVLLSGSVLYCYVYADSGTLAHPQADDVRDVLRLKDVLDDYVELGLLRTEERAGMLCSDLNAQYFRVGNVVLGGGQLRAMRTAWKDILADVDIRACVSLVEPVLPLMRLRWLLGKPLLQRGLVTPALLWARATELVARMARKARRR